MSLGALNPCALALGGGRSRTETLYRYLRGAIGPNGPGPVGGVEDTWRMAKAYGLARAAALNERAASQAFPHTASDSIPVWEVLLATGTSEDDPYQERVDAITAIYASQQNLTIPGLLDTLRAIDPAIDYVTPTWADEGTTQLGRHFKESEPGSSGHDTAIQWVNYASTFIVVLFWPAGDEGFPQPQYRQLARLLNKSLPAWVSWDVWNTTDGFDLDDGGGTGSFLDLSPLD